MAQAATAATAMLAAMTEEPTDDPGLPPLDPMPGSFAAHAMQATTSSSR
jgi:hypothetical protein